MGGNRGDCNSQGKQQAKNGSGEDTIPLSWFASATGKLCQLIWLLGSEKNGREKARRLKTTLAEAEPSCQVQEAHLAPNCLQ
jgi:hypothetical protein